MGNYSRSNTNRFLHAYKIAHKVQLFYYFSVIKFIYSVKQPIVHFNEFLSW